MPKVKVEVSLSKYINLNSYMKKKSKVIMAKGSCICNAIQYTFTYSPAMQVLRRGLWMVVRGMGWGLVIRSWGLSCGLKRELSGRNGGNSAVCEVFLNWLRRNVRYEGQKVVRMRVWSLIPVSHSGIKAL